MRKVSNQPVDVKGKGVQEQLDKPAFEQKLRDRADEYACDAAYTGYSRAELEAEASRDIEREQKEAAQMAIWEAEGAFDDIVQAQAKEQARRDAEFKREKEEAAAKEAAFRATPEGKALTKAEERQRKEDRFWAEMGEDESGSDHFPRWLEELCDSPPPAGEGVHKWLFQMARQLHAHFPDKDELFRYMRQKADRAERVMTDREIQGAIDYSADCAWGMTGAVDLQKIDWDKRRPWPEPDLKKIAEIVNKGAALSHLIKSSPTNCSGERRHTRWLLKQLFPGDPMLCMALEINKAATQKLSAWLQMEVEYLSFIVPSAMTAATGHNMQDEVSSRCLDNTGPREYLAIEFDFSEFMRDGKTRTKFAPLIQQWKKEGVQINDACASLLWHLSTYLDLTMALWSGGKSEHGWFSCRGEREEDLLKFMRYAVSIGADPATWTRCQLVRLPDGTRFETGVRQQVHYFDPSTVRRP